MKNSKELSTEKDVEKAERILQRCKKKYGENAEETIDAMDFLTEILEDVGRMEDAHVLREQVVAARKGIYEQYREKYGKDDEKTINAMIDAAALLEEMERYEEAATLREELVNVCQRKYGEMHADTSMHLGALLQNLLYAGQTENLQKRLEQEADLLMKSITKCKKNIDDVENDMLDGIFNVYDELYTLICRIESEDETLEHLREKVAGELQSIRENIAKVCNMLLIEEKTDHWEPIRRMPGVFEDCEEWDEAIAMHRKIIAFRQMKDCEDEDKAALLNALEDMAAFLDVHGKKKEHIQVQEKMADIHRKAAEACREVEIILGEAETKCIEQIEKAAKESAAAKETKEFLANIRKEYVYILKDKIYHLEELKQNLELMGKKEEVKRIKRELLDAFCKRKEMATTKEEVDEVLDYIEEIEEELGIQGDGAKEK